MSTKDFEQNNLSDHASAVMSWLRHLAGERRVSPKTLEAYGRAVEANPVLSAAWKMLAAGWQGLDDERAAAARAQLAQIEQQDPGLLAALAAWHDGDYALAEARVRPFLLRVPDDPVGMRLLAELGARLGEYEDAELILAKCIEFHPDSVTDCRWEVTRRMTVPESLPSGIYAMRLRIGPGVGIAEEYIVFVVRPKVPRGKLCFLVPTASYLAYGNESLSFDAHIIQPMTGQPPVVTDLDIETYEHREYGLSTYDHFEDAAEVPHVQHEHHLAIPGRPVDRRLD